MRNNPSFSPVLISCLIIAVVLCVCLSLISLAGAGLILFRSSPSTSIELTATNTPQDTNQQMDQIEMQISDLRGLAAKSSVNRQLLSPSELRQHVLDDFLKDYSPEDAHRDALVLWAFGLLDSEFDLLNFYEELYSEQIAGFYDQETEEMYVVQDESFLGPERLTYAHEFTHALQDQYYDIENGLRYNDDDCEFESERCAAVSALLEGDASLTESLWFSSHATDADQKEISQFYSRFQSPVYDSAPEFMKEDFLFPYQQGKTFVETLYDDGGWAAVDQAYLNPPSTSEQILHPDHYPEDIPETLDLDLFPADLGTGWEELDRGMMGEWYTSLILFAGLNPEWRIARRRAEQAAAGWESDGYVVFYHADQDQLVMVFQTNWDNQREARDYQQAFENYAGLRFGQPDSDQAGLFWESDQGVHAFFTQGVTTAWILAPETSTANQLWQALSKR